MFSFRLFGFEVEVEFFFLLTALFVSGGMDPPYDIPLILVNVLMVFVAILWHELGHAIVMSRYRLDPSIRLSGLMGLTIPRTDAPTTRPQRVLISLAGPFAGFLQAGLLLALFTYAPQLLVRLPMVVRSGLQFLFVIDVYWSLFNLIPVLPLDGGNVLAQALGPKRARTTALISLIVGVIAAGLFAVRHQWWAAIFLAYFAYQSYQLWQVEPAAPTPRPKKDEPAPDDLPPEAAALLQSARHAIAEDETERALTLARRVLEGDDGSFAATPKARGKAFEVVAWARLGSGDVAGANDALAEAKKLGATDPAVVGAVALARGESGEARRVLEAAAAKGDRRREVFGPLVQALLAEGEVARAAAAMLEIVDQLSEEDVRRMATLAFDDGRFEWAAKLSEALFSRTKDADDAYEAARALAKDGEVDRALEMLKRAVDAGFSDRARAWSDAALEALRARRLDDVLPRP